MRDFLLLELNRHRPKRFSFVNTAEIDFNSSHDFVRHLAERSGLTIGQISRMTIEGHTPWLLGERRRGGEISAPRHRTLSIIRAPSRRSVRLSTTWREWIAARSVRRVCPICLLEHGKKFSMLLWQLPILLSCPVHHCILVPFETWDLAQLMGSFPFPFGASDFVTTQDQRTWNAFTKGYVNLPGGCVDASMWCNILQTMLDELIRAIPSDLKQGPDLKRIWHELELQTRDGTQHWQHFGGLRATKKLIFLEAAAFTTSLIEGGSFQPLGFDAKLFLSHSNEGSVRPIEQSLLRKINH